MVFCYGSPSRLIQISTVPDSYILGTRVKKIISNSRKQFCPQGCHCLIGERNSVRCGKCFTGSKKKKMQTILTLPHPSGESQGIFLNVHITEL